MTWSTVVISTAQYYPVGKIPSLDMSDLNNYWPISNLSFLSKTVERLVDARFTAYAENSSLLPPHQFAYRAQHSTETALVHLYNMVATVDRGEVIALVLLDMSAPFDTIDYHMMLDVLQQRFDDWFASYFADLTQVVRIGVPLESVLGPRSFVAYAKNVTEIFHRHHLFVDDMQGIRHSKPSKVQEVTTGPGASVTAVNDWCASKRLQLNTKKQKCCGLARRQTSANNLLLKS